LLALSCCRQCAFPASRRTPTTPTTTRTSSSSPAIAPASKAPPTRSAIRSASDTVFAEDIGKFPDTNIAESLNRVPGVTITREISGDGLNVAIRGLGTNFTRVLLNNAPIAIASTGRTDSQNTNREVDLDLFPTELFTQLTVHKSPTAD
jgi:outer membrane receptor for ferrienterochelin and colicin